MSITATNDETSAEQPTQDADVECQTYADCLTPDDTLLSTGRVDGSTTLHEVVDENNITMPNFELPAETESVIEVAKEAEMIEKLNKSINPTEQFPMAPDTIWDSSKTAKQGDSCLMAWCFSDSSQLNISKGVVKSVKKRAGIGRMSLQYEGIEGYKCGEQFRGFIPPNSNVRVYSIQWLHRKDSKSRIDVDAKGIPSNQGFSHTEADLDFDPMPTMRTVSAEFVPCVVSIYRDIMRDYADSSYDQRNQIWHRTMSAMKHSLATVLIGKKRRRRPIQTQETNAGNSEVEQKAKDLRAVKKATRLVLEGAIKKATRVLDQDITETSLGDEEKLSQLQKLHPSLPISFELPTDAPKVACIPPHELREEGKRLAKGAAPGPSGTTEAIILVCSWTMRSVARV